MCWLCKKTQGAAYLDECREPHLAESYYGGSDGYGKQSYWLAGKYCYNLLELIWRPYVYMLIFFHGDTGDKTNSTTPLSNVEQGGRICDSKLASAALTLFWLIMVSVLIAGFFSFWRIELQRTNYNGWMAFMKEEMTIVNYLISFILGITTVWMYRKIRNGRFEP